MIDAPYVELHARSAFSFLRGASIPELYAAYCGELAEQESLGHAMALTDVDGVYGSVRFHSSTTGAASRK
jgi:error-prone DNA polymerase